MECIVNEQGELLEILQIGQEKELQEGQSIVPLSNFYDVLNLERFEKSIWNFELEKWVGTGKQRPVLEPQISEVEILKQRLAEAEAKIKEITGDAK